MCKHKQVLVNKHPRHADYVLESCSTCQELRAYNINTTEPFIVHNGFNIIRMCEGPAGSLLVLDKSIGLCKLKLDWPEDPLKEGQVVCIGHIVSQGINKQLLRFCYAINHDILLCTVKDCTEDRDYEILAMKLGSEKTSWRLSGKVDGHVIKPECMTCDPDGNTYVSDRASNRIMKIDGLTGEILSTSLLDEEEIMIISMHWSNTEPNLTLRARYFISTYYVSILI